MTEGQTGLTKQRAEFQVLPVEQLRESKTNPRQAHGDLTELVESIREKGVLQPILVRPANGAGGYELVFGHRRLRAARQAGLEEIPAIVREMDDREVLEAQIVENCQRTDIHPLEEADGYRRLHEEHGYSIEDLAVKVGKSKAYVYARLKLCSLAPASRRAFLEGKLPPSTALLVARIPVAELQDEATKEILRGEGGGGDPLGVREASRHIHSHYMLGLSGAPFRTGDADLFPEAGPCTTCSKRTGNQRELFDDVKSADVCTDPRCFERKRDLAWALRVKEAEAKGQKVLSEKEAKKILWYRGDYGLGGDYVKLAGRCWDDPKNRTWRDLLGKHAPTEVTLARDENDRVVELVNQKAARLALKAAGHDFGPATGSRADSRYADQTRARAKKARLEASVRRRIFEVLVEQLEKAISGPASLTHADLEATARAVFCLHWNDTQKVIVGRLGWAEGGKGRSSLEASAARRIKGLSTAQLARLLVVLGLGRDLDAPSWGSIGKLDELIAAAKRYGVNPDRIRKEITAAAAAKDKAATKGKKAKDQEPGKRSKAKAS